MKTDAINEDRNVEYEFRRQEIIDLNDRILKFIPFTFTVISALTTWGYKDGIIIAYLISNILLLWATSYLIHCRQFISINASYCSHYYENEWEIRLGEFRNMYKTIRVRNFEAIFFITITIFNTLLIFLTDKNSKFLINTSGHLKNLIGVISTIISVLTLIILFKGLLETRRNIWSMKFSKIWKAVDINLKKAKEIDIKEIY